MFQMIKVWVGMILAEPRIRKDHQEHDSILLPILQDLLSSVDELSRNARPMLEGFFPPPRSIPTGLDSD